MQFTTKVFLIQLSVLPVQCCAVVEITGVEVTAKLKEKRVRREKFSLLLYDAFILDCRTS